MAKIERHLVLDEERLADGWQDKVVDAAIDSQAAIPTHAELLAADLNLVKVAIMTGWGKYGFVDLDVLESLLYNRSPKVQKYEIDTLEEAKAGQRVLAEGWSSLARDGHLAFHAELGWFVTRAGVATYG